MHTKIVTSVRYIWFDQLHNRFTFRPCPGREYYVGFITAIENGRVLWRKPVDPDQPSLTAKDALYNAEAAAAWLRKTDAV